ncbi:TPA: site-specific integrase [Klebsiella pneumoniae]|uniref:tyrosine-type recombinase/integrase n=1 Tax=Klebsiella pneumoniae TaxID=573 RepID=UPI0020CE4126|nr:site-specific integrase [Klebsiella pneumoniae]MCQ0814105.1 site-specific integrase [Klebsiella pneumoniae]HBS2458729.1 site-specific integrase [Klebsiella pneumoniae]HBS2469867.1 site-specific integrase [Klebsiella pneumoniae]HBS2497993.1 site-specific integrase [Klebsiella pneumoniae]HBS2525803.1 site-specific integrase [Klebsiella pneumoniae]
MAGLTNKLSDKKLRALLGSERSKEEMMADGEGLSVRLFRSGSISWIFAYRLGGRGSKLERLTLGSYPDMSLKVAREKREECRSWLAEGKNPKFQLDIRTEEILKPVTVRDAMSYWIREYATHHRVNVNRHEAQLDKHIYPYIGDLPLSLCETRHWLDCFDRAKRDTPVAAGYVFQMCKQALKFCRVRRYAISNALDDLTIQDVGKKQDKGDRVHDMDELAQIWRSCSAKLFKPYYASLLRLLVVFGCRSQEVRLSTWGEWDLKNWIWTVPKEHSKGGGKIIRPIPVVLRPFITGLFEQNKHSGLLLGEMKKAEAVSQWGRGIYKRLGHVEPWTLHDLRRTFSTTLNNMGIAPHVVEQLLGHTLGGVMAVYNRSQYLPEKLDALNKWMERLDLISDAHANVTILKVAK